MRQFAKLCGVNQATISRLEMNGIKAHDLSEPDNEILAKIAPYLGMSFIELVLIGLEQHQTKNKEFDKAEDLLPLLGNLPIEEIKRLQNMLSDRIQAVDVLEREFL